MRAPRLSAGELVGCERVNEAYFIMKDAFCCEFVVMLYWMAASSVAIGATRPTAFFCDLLLIFLLAELFVASAFDLISGTFYIAVCAGCTGCWGVCCVGCTTRSLRRMPSLPDEPSDEEDDDDVLPPPPPHKGGYGNDEDGYEMPPKLPSTYRP